MKTHLKIVAIASLLFGYVIAYGFISGQILFFSVVYKRDISVFDNGISAFTNFLNQYLRFFNEYGIAWWGLLISLLWIGILLSFGHGLLKHQEWARKLGFVIAGLNIFSFFAETISGLVTLQYSFLIGFTGYMLWVLLADESKKLCNKTGDEKA